MSLSRQAAAFVTVAGVALLCTSRASATSGFELERYTPSTVGEWSFWVDKPWYTDGPNFLAAGLSFDYAHHPLVVGERNAQGVVLHTKPVIAHQLVAHFEAAVSFLDRVTADLDLPLILKEDGSARFGVAPLQRPALSSPRVGAVVRILGHSMVDALSVHAGLALWVPLRQNSLSSSATVAALPKIIASGVFADQFLYSAFVGFLIRPVSSAGDLAPAAGGVVGPELQVGGSLSWADLIDRFAVGPEAVCSVGFTGSPVSRYSTSLELFLGAHYNPTGYFQTGLAVGTGLLQAPGTPDFRGLVRLAYTPELQEAPDTLVRDRDGDGVTDSRDACPDTYGAPNADPALHGCPSDRDHDGVHDAQDACPDTPAGDTPDPARAGCPLVDSDKDGVFDPNDACPDEPTGPHADPARAGCPDGDKDGDGVFDSQDACPDIPQGGLPDASKQGCPVADRDKDLVPDEEDSCPDTPGAPNPNRAKNGCPGLVKIEGDVIKTEPLFFASGKDRILSKSYPVLQMLADVLAARPGIKRISIEGHTDNAGNPAKNLDLSERRAKSVMTYLISHGVDPARVEAHGFGDTRPITSNATAEGRAVNRRVEFKIVQ